ncbi:DM13 domain-containing protein [Pseudoalteromonas tunicata]|uniref:Phenylalanyl-tRNA synthetase beta subunit n=1 Tax=Pseudoalteromonas tunicata D2 TaxID=87626 RepID=A4CFP6_9GAMM|nr:DM13 domain-containing protein [Pseudoalteromonas tunicata]ATC94144.1 hypothetical protein PTUN_a1527 [Pseudoalteromonas tunicata]AXT29911.1 hypothetical protein D1819_03155 [Pseudoalteromonas tunicata]EAR26473.1 Phenylalanyl-tRNA synthetase beta subunit [Pseudoalteromonas tunicata D2]
MNSKRLILLLATHLSIAVMGFMAGIYTLPILIAQPAPLESDLLAVSSRAIVSAKFERHLQDSDFLHFGEGEVFISQHAIAFVGTLAPGPDYQLYLSPEFVETELDFNRLKAQMVQVGAVKTFNNFLVALPAHIDPTHYNTVIVWCDSFNQFITSAQYQHR